MKHLLNNLTEQEKNSIRKQHDGGINVVAKNFKKLSNSKLGTVNPLLNEQETQKQTPSIINKVATEGLKNVLPDMISSPQFKGTYSGDVFGGVFKGTDYQWDCNGVEGQSGIRGMINGEIITETIENMASSIRKTISDGKPGTPCVGFYSKNLSFIIYTTTNGNPKCLYF